ncbi:hypothetical protein, partial [Thermococcus sp. Bubb.Bath]|uniref:hypothetical protein n=1 Tax=Thermococcus sp. Bubb.Bath TaxID=1638242 RepID=UPI00143B9ACA
AVNPHDLVVKVDGNVTDSINVELTGNETHTVEVYYNGHLIKSENITIHAVSWDVSFDFATNGTVYKYVDNMLYVTVHVNGPSVPVNVSINGN